MWKEERIPREKRRYIIAEIARVPARHFCTDQRERILQEMDESKRIDGDPFYKITDPPIFEIGD